MTATVGAAGTMTPMSIWGHTGRRLEFRGEDSNPYTRHQKPLSCQLDDPGSCGAEHRCGLTPYRDARHSSRCTDGTRRTDGNVGALMGSLVKKRRKRMRKKKHKKMLRRTRHQRRK